MCYFFTGSFLKSCSCVALRCIALGVVLVAVAVPVADFIRFFFFHRNGWYKTTKKIADFWNEKRGVATMNFGSAEKVILGKYHLAFHSKKNICRKKSRGYENFGYEKLCRW
jgi:hypothetical protein